MFLTSIYNILYISNLYKHSTIIIYIKKSIFSIHKKKLFNRDNKINTTKKT